MIVRFVSATRAIPKKLAPHQGTMASHFQSILYVLSQPEMTPKTVTFFLPSTIDSSCGSSIDQANSHSRKQFPQKLISNMGTSQEPVDEQAKLIRQERDKLMDIQDLPTCIYC